MFPKYQIDRYIGYIGEIRINAPFLVIIGITAPINGQKWDKFSDLREVKNKKNTNIELNNAIDVPKVLDIQIYLI